MLIYIFVIVLLWCFRPSCVGFLALFLAELYAVIYCGYLVDIKGYICVFGRFVLCAYFKKSVGMAFAIRRIVQIFTAVFSVRQKDEKALIYRFRWFITGS